MIHDVEDAYTSLPCGRLSSMALKGNNETLFALERGD